MKYAMRSLPLALVPLWLVLSSGCGKVTTSSPTNPQSAAQIVNVAISEDNVDLGAGESYQFAAVVTGAHTSAVIWTVQNCTGDTCGTISSTGFYTAPLRVSSPTDIRVVATSQEDTSKSDTVNVHHKPIAVSIAPKEIWISPGKSIAVTASVLFDIRKAGVIWSLNCSNSSCGTLSNATASSVSYTAPAEFVAPPAVTLIATSASDLNRFAKAIVSESATATLAEGDYAFLFSGWELHFSRGYWPFRYAAAGHFHADGKGNILEGVEDINSIGGISHSVPFTGSYAVGTDRLGTLTILTAEGTASYHMVLEPSGTKARFIRYDGLPSNAPVSGAGYLELQDKAAFFPSFMNGDYAMGMYGAGSGNDWRGVATVGSFTVGPGGAIIGGEMDKIVQSGGSRIEPGPSNFVLTGSFSEPSTASGRGTATLLANTAGNGLQQNMNLTYYVISAEKILLIQTDTRTADYSGSVLSGEARRQHGPFTSASFDGPAIFSMAGVSREGYGAYYEHIEVGQLVADGSSEFAGVVDDNGYPYPTKINQAFYGSYAVAANGRSALQLGDGYVKSAVAYLYGPRAAFLMETSPGTDILFGNIRPQVTGPFDPSSISGTFLTVTAPPTSEESENECGLTTFNGESGATSRIDTNSSLNDDSQKWLQHFDLSGSYEVAPNGRGTITFSSQDRTIVFWIASPKEMVGNAAHLSDGYDYIGWAALLEFTR